MPQNIICFKGKTALVTGATRGIGRAIATMLIEHECEVFGTGTQDLPGSRPIEKMHYMVLDLSRTESTAAFIRQIEQFEQIDILINNAGINVIDPIEHIKTEDWDRIIQVNLSGAMIIMQAVAQKMIRNKTAGKILNISSIFGIVSKEKRAAYCSSKAGLLGLTRTSAVDLARYNIIVNALCPGFTQTELTDSILTSEEQSALAADIPLGRFADTLEIARAALFLCSDLNTYMTGQVLIADGGFIIR